MCVCVSEVLVQSTEELRQQKSYVKTLKKQSKELKDLHKKHLKKVPSPGRKPRDLPEPNLSLLSESLGTSANILTPRFPSPRTFTNHSRVSDVGGAKSYLLVSSAGLDTSPLVFF